MIQIDHMKLFDRELGERFIEFSGIDATTRIKSSYIYRTATSKNAKDFLINHLIPTLPFNIKSIQVDGGSEFRKHFPCTLHFVSAANFRHKLSNESLLLFDNI